LLVGAVELPVEGQLLGAKVLDHIKQVGVHGDGTSQVTLSSRKIRLSLFLLSIAALLHLVELVLQVEHDLGWSANFETVQVDDVTETEHLTLAVLANLLLQLLFELADLLFLLHGVLLSLMLFLVQALDLLV